MTHFRKPHFGLALSVALGVALLAPARAGAATVTFFGPTPYLSLEDSPIFDPADDFIVEDFEDGVFDMPGMEFTHGLVSGATLAPDGNTDSVDADDGVIDGFGRDGWSFLVPDGAIALTFVDAPAHQIGFVWTDGVPGGRLRVALDFRAGGGETFTAIIPGDGTFGGTTGDDVFVGVKSSRQIQSIFIAYEQPIGTSAPLAFELDHFQYAFLPEPALPALVALGLAAAVLRRRRSRGRESWRSRPSRAEGSVTPAGRPSP